MTAPDRHQHEQPDLFALLAKQIIRDWHIHAACADMPVNAFYPDPRARSKSAAAAAIEVCNACPARRSCRAVALLRDEHGVWGGTTEADRDRMRASLERNVPVEVVLDETVQIGSDDAAVTAA